MYRLVLLVGGTVDLTAGQGTGNDSAIGDGSSPSPGMWNPSPGFFGEEPSPGAGNPSPGDFGTSPSPGFWSPSPGDLGTSPSPGAWSPSPGGFGTRPSPGRDITDQVLPPFAQAVLAAGKAAYCPLYCKNYFAGASHEMPIVAQPLPSGVGDLAADAESTRGIVANCYPPFGVGPPYTEDWNICLQKGMPLPSPNRSRPELHQGICRDTIALGGKNLSGLPSSGGIGARSTSEVTEARWMMTKGSIGCGWGSTMSNVAPGAEGGYEDWIAKFGYYIKEERTNSFDGKAIENDEDCCMYAMSFDGTPWKDGGSAVRFQFSSQDGCRVNRETMVRGNLDRSGGLALENTATCGDGFMFWRHATGAADAANLKGETPCEKSNGFEVLKGDSDALQPVGSLPDHFTSNWGNEFPNHACDKWPYGGCKGVIGYNTISSPEECCEACVTLKWIEEQGGDVSKVEKWDESTGQYRMVFSNPCAAWQVVGGKCRIMREQMVREYSRFSGGTVRDAIMRGGSCQEDGVGERNCNYYSFARFRETFEAPTWAPTPTPTKPATFPGVTWAPTVVPPVNESKPKDDVATFAKMLLMDLLDGRSAEEYLAQAAQGEELSIDISAVVSTLVGRGSSQRMFELLQYAQGQTVDEDMGPNATCAKIRLYSSTDLTYFNDGSIALPVGSSAPQPWCESEVCISNGVLHLHCSVTNFAVRLPLEGRRLSGAESPKAVLVFGSDGTGKDESLFDNLKITTAVGSGGGGEQPAGSGGQQTNGSRCIMVKNSVVAAVAAAGWKVTKCGDASR